MVSFIKVEVAGLSAFSFDRKLLNIIHELRRMRGDILIKEFLSQIFHRVFLPFREHASLKLLGLKKKKISHAHFLSLLQTSSQ